jgi:hypothetical protein
MPTVLSTVARAVCAALGRSVVLLTKATSTNHSLAVDVVIVVAIEVVEGTVNEVEAVASGAPCLVPVKAIAPAAICKSLLEGKVMTMSYGPVPPGKLASSM